MAIPPECPHGNYRIKTGGPYYRQVHPRNFQDGRVLPPAFILQETSCHLTLSLNDGARTTAQRCHLEYTQQGQRLSIAVARIDRPRTGRLRSNSYSRFSKRGYRRPCGRVIREADDQPATKGSSPVAQRGNKPERDGLPPGKTVEPHISPEWSIHKFHEIWHNESEPRRLHYKNPQKDHDRPCPGRRDTRRLRRPSQNSRGAGAEGMQACLRRTAQHPRTGRKTP